MELEPIVTDWLGQGLGLPKEFISSTPGSVGGGTKKKVFKTLKTLFLGAVFSSASEGTLMSILAARAQAFKHIHDNYPLLFLDDNEILPKLVLYTSKEAHSSVEKAAMIALVQLRILDVDESSSMRGPTLQKVKPSKSTSIF